MRVGCGNRPQYVGANKVNEDQQKSITTESRLINNKSINKPVGFCRTCKLNPMAEIVEEEIITNNDCNINRNPRFINGKTRSYGIIYTMLNCGIIVDFLEINLSEQVFITLFHWINMLKKLIIYPEYPTYSYMIMRATCGFISKNG